MTDALAYNGLKLTLAGDEALLAGVLNGSVLSSWPKRSARPAGWAGGPPLTSSCKEITVMPLSAGHGFVFLAFLVIVGIPLWGIVKRSGMHPALSLLWFVPLVNVIFLWVFAFAEWPSLKQQSPASQ